MLRVAIRHGVVFDVININDPEDIRRLEKIADLDGEPSEWRR